MKSEKYEQLLLALFNTLKPFVGHQGHCHYGQNNPDGDFCTCGLRAAKDQANDILKEAQLL